MHLLYLETEVALEGSNSRTRQTSVIAASYNPKNGEKQNEEDEISGEDKRSQSPRRRGDPW